MRLPDHPSSDPLSLPPADDLPDSDPISQPRSVLMHMLRNKSRRSAPPRAATLLPRSRTSTTLPTISNSLVGRFARGTRNDARFGSRVSTDTKTLNAKAAILPNHSGLSLDTPLDSSDRLVMCGINALRAEILDMVAMLAAMHAHATTLSHHVVETFFNWITPFAAFLERYLLIEEAFIVKPLEQHVQTLRADLRPSIRMKARGTLQRCLQDVRDVEHLFTPNVPAGQRLGQLNETVEQFISEAAKMFTIMTTQLPQLFRTHFKPRQVDRLSVKLVKHLVAHAGYKEFLAVYTRWMPSVDLLEWKATILLPCDFKFFSYAVWDKSAEQLHYSIAATFWHNLDKDNEQSGKDAEQSKKDFERAKASRAELDKAKGANDFDEDMDMHDDDVLYDDDEVACAQTTHF